MQCLDRKTIDVVDDYLSELVLPKDISKSEIVTENKYTFKDGKIEQVKVIIYTIHFATHHGNDELVN